MHHLIYQRRRSTMQAPPGVCAACCTQLPCTPASTLTGQPTAALILSQCLSRSPGFLRAAISGTCCWNSCSCWRTASATCRGAPVSCFSSLALPRHHLGPQGQHKPASASSRGVHSWPKCVLNSMRKRMLALARNKSGRTAHQQRLNNNGSSKRLLTCPHQPTPPLHRSL